VDPYVYTPKAGKGPEVFDEDTTLQDFENFLGDAGVDVSRFGHGAAKPLKAFLNEVIAGKCCLKWDQASAV
jgi:hypothetical protein